MPNHEIFRVRVDYGRNLEQMIRSGKYDWVNNHITAVNFPINGTGSAETDLILVHFDTNVIIDDIRSYFESAGLMFAFIEHLLALGEMYPYKQRNFTISALGSCTALLRDRTILGHFVPCLGSSGSDRGLELFRMDNKWKGSCRFAAIKK